MNDNPGLALPGDATPSRLPALPQRITAGARAYAPDYRQIVLLAGIALAVAAGIWLFTWSQQPGMVPLYAGLSEKDTAEVVAALERAEIPFRLDPSTGAVTVPEERVHEIRLQLATQGLPEGNPRAGIEMIEGEQGFGVSQFIEGARYQHALETELARTIATLRPIRSARVHLALPKPSAFTKNRESATASVVVELHPGRELERNQIAAITHTVASAIPGMDPARVTVVDQRGEMLTEADPGSDEAISNRRFEQARKLESGYAERIRALLEPVTGAGRSRVQVHIDMDFSEIEEARETWGNDPAKVRGEKTAESWTTTPSPLGIPGATSNTPPVQPLAAGASGTANAAVANGTAERSATRSFELDRTLVHTRQGPGRVRRVTAAVVVDNIPRATAKGVVAQPLTDAEIQRLEALVRQAIGFDAARGDALSVVNAAFAPSEAVALEPAPWWSQVSEQAPPWTSAALRVAIGALLVLVIVLGVLRPALRSLLPPARPDEVPLGDAGEATDAVGSATAHAGPATGAAAALPPPGDVEHAFERARLAVGEDPRRVAQVMKNWIAANG